MLGVNEVRFRRSERRVEEASDLPLPPVGEQVPVVSWGRGFPFDLVGTPPLHGLGGWARTRVLISKS